MFAVNMASVLPLSLQTSKKTTHMTTEVERPFYIKSAYILITATLVVLILYLGKIVIVPLIFALFVAILLNPIVSFLTKRKVPRGFSIPPGSLFAT